MQPINKNILLFLNNNLNPDYLLKNSFYNFDNVFSFFRNYNSIIDYDYYLNKFPLYQTSNFRPITSLRLQDSSFSSIKIKTVVEDNLKDIMENLSPDVLSTKSEIDKYFGDTKLIKFTASLQKTILNDEHINKNVMELNTSRLDTNYDYFFYILNQKNIPEYHNSYDSIDSIEILTMYYMVLNLFVNNSNFYHSMSELIYLQDDVNEKLLEQNFEEFLINNKKYNQETDSFTYILVNFIHRKLFNIYDPSQNYINKAHEDLKKSFIPKLIDCFKKYIKDVGVQKKIIMNYVRRIQNIFVYLIFKKMLNENVFDFFKDNYNRSSELNYLLSYDYVNNVIGRRMSTNNLKKYMMPVYLYKNDPLKFLNVISRFVQLYCDDYMKKHIEYIEKSTNRFRTYNHINEILKNIDSEELDQYFRRINYQEIKDEGDLGWLMSFFTTNDIIKGFCNSSLFTDFIVDSLNNTRDYLYRNKWITHDFNWYKDIDLIRHFILSYFLKHSCLEIDGQKNNYVFKDLQDTFNYYLDQTIHSERFFTGTPERFRIYMDNMRNVPFLQDSIYNGTSNFLDATFKKQIYFQILSYYIE